MRNRIRLFVAGFSLLVVLVAQPPAAHADPLVVTDGLVRAHVNLHEARQQFTGENFSLLILGSFTTTVDCYGCAPGTEIALDGRLLDVQTRADFTLDGQTYDDDRSYSLSGTLTTSHFVLPLLPPSDPFTVALPFVFTGELNVYPFAGAEQPMSTFQMIGTGTATAEFAFLDQSEGCDPPCYYLGNVANIIDYDFGTDAAPVPEPTTILLVGGALLVGARKLRNG
jgi:hypothetical protein